MNNSTAPTINIFIYLILLVSGNMFIMNYLKVDLRSEILELIIWNILCAVGRNIYNKIMEK